MPEVSMVFGHGGHSTAMLALAHDLPMVVMPMFKMVDQPRVGRALQKADAGRVVAKDAAVEKIRGVVQDVLASDSCRSAAAGLGARIRTNQGLRRAADAVEVTLSAPAAITR
jgi:UDP:flavonoid glycosyltransferase YjiC (YdhE family)